METILPPGEDGKIGLSLWEDATMFQIRAHAEGQGIAVTRMIFTNVEQELKAGCRAAGRSLQEQTLEA